LPSDFLDSAARRLGWSALLYAGEFAIAYTVVHLTYLGGSSHWLSLLAVSVAILVSVLLYLVVRSRRFDSCWLLDVGLGYWVFGALCIDLTYYLGVLSKGLSSAGISWVCVWLVVYPLVVPNKPRKVLIAAIAAASMGPLAFLVAWKVTGADLPRAFHFGGAFAPYYLCAALAYVTARIVHRMGIAVREAREMGSYRLIRKLGSGGMGEVWLAKHRLLTRPAAVKFVPIERVLRNSVSTDTGQGLLTRFEREAQATAALHCPHTIELYDFGVTEDGTLYYAMEYLEGLSAESLVKRFGPVPLDRTVHLLMQVCESLQDAHHAGLVHRDIKPGNIFICRYGRRYDFVKVLDFGLVKGQNELAPTDDRLTQAGTITGTPAYMAPELALGRADVDARADLYSLGCTAYWLLTGRTVFTGTTGMEVIMQQVHELPAPPSAVTGAPIPPDLEDLIMKCLEKDPDKRIQSAEEVAQRLSRIPLDNPWASEQAEAWWQEHQPVATAPEDDAVSSFEETAYSPRSHATAFQVLTQRGR